MPAIVHRAAQNDLNPSIGRTTRFTLYDPALLIVDRKPGRPQRGKPREAAIRRHRTPIIALEISALHIGHGSSSTKSSLVALVVSVLGLQIAGSGYLRKFFLSTEL
jgi:hypothetical protein